MRYIDESKIYIKSGNGGNGCVSFRREKFVAFGGPDGGNGGSGGNIIFECVNNINTLVDFRFKQHFQAQSGEQGKGRNRNGKSGDDIILKVPVGTQIYSEDSQILIHDFVRVGEQVTLCHGGKGGIGNSFFKTSINQAPKHATEGERGEDFWVWLKLKLLADVGLLGLPNAGKSTFLSKVTAAKPKIANYPFTTLTPQLGVVRADIYEYVIADVPGIIEGANEGHGLGIRFLKHLERCSVLLHIIDGHADNIQKNYLQVKKEVEKFGFNDKPEVVAISKSESIPDEDLEVQEEFLRNVTDSKIYRLSSLSGQNLDQIKFELHNMIRESKLLETS